MSENDKLKLVREDQFGKTFTHESFGIMSFCRFQSSNNESYYGSSIKERDGISLEISHSELHRSDLHYDTYGAAGQIIRIDLTPTQFAEVLTSANVGMGIPVTIKWFDGRRMEDPPFISKLHQFTEEFEESTAKIAKELDDLLTKAKDKKYPKSFIHDLEMAIGSVKSHLPFIKEEFDEQMERTIHEAKGAVEAFMGHAAKYHGIDAKVNLELGPGKGGDDNATHER